MRILKHNIYMKCINIVVSIILIFVSSGCDFQYDIQAFLNNDLIISGHIESTIINVNSEVTGKVVTIYKEEGNEVKKNDVLVHLDSTEAELEVMQAEINVKIKEEKLKQIRIGSRHEQIKAAEASVDAAKYKMDEYSIGGSKQDELEQARLNVDSAKAEYEYYEKDIKNKSYLYDNGAIAQNDLNKAVKDFEMVKISLQTAKSKLKQIENDMKVSSYEVKANYDKEASQLNLLQNGSTLEEIKTAEYELDNAKVALHNAKVRLAKCDIVSPVDGIYVLKNVNIGDTVTNGTNIGKVSDVRELYAKVYVPQKYINYINIGQGVILKSIALPNQVINGKVKYIAPQSEFLPQDVDKDEAEKNTVFEVRIRIVDNLEKMKVGMTIDAYIKNSK